MVLKSGTCFIPGKVLNFIKYWIFEGTVYFYNLSQITLFSEKKIKGLDSENGLHMVIKPKLM